MSRNHFLNLEPYEIVPLDVYGSEWSSSLETLLCSDLSLYVHAFKPPVKGQRYVEETFDDNHNMALAVAVAGSDFPSIQPRIILGRRSTIKSNPSCKWNKQPLIGSIVRYVTCDGVILPAIVLTVGAGEKTDVHLQVFGVGDSYKWARYTEHPPNMPGISPRTWHWPND